ncbi:MAG: uroporphyrinogen-III C-methyltransferase [Amylibacter sp.]|nr:uroporphyrinogen-III C-methyltransferase [Amylibacter sp.]
MRHFPIFLDLNNRPVIVAGAGACAIAKLRLLLKTDAQIHVFGPHPKPQVLHWAQSGLLTYHDRPANACDMQGATLVYGATENAVEDKRVTDLGRAAGALVNIVDNLEASQFITPAIVDRAPVTVAIGTEGAAPVLARKIKQQLEEALPTDLGTLARIGQSFRKAVNTIPMGRQRRDFWSNFYFQRGPQALAKGGKDAVIAELALLLDETQGASDGQGHVSLVGSGPGDPELLTLKARNLLHGADVVIYDHSVPNAILELARREAVVIETGKKNFGAAWKPAQINALLIKHAKRGHHVVRLQSGNPVVSTQTAALAQAGIDHSVIPGIAAPIAYAQVEQA